ncbi:MAG: head completion/stabilization protein [Psychromonas sp.]
MRMEFVGNKNEEYDVTLPATALYPALSIAEFQQVFHFLSNETKESIVYNMNVTRIIINQELLQRVKVFGSLNAFSIDAFGEDKTGDTLYKQAVFAFTAYYLIKNQLSMNATEEATERQEAIQAKADNCLVQYRRAIDLLLNAVETYRFEVI